MINPANAGPFSYNSVVYASPGLVYPAVLSAFLPFSHPDTNYVTGTIDISDFSDVSPGTPWPFPNTAVPINGYLRVPQGTGPFH